MNSFIFCNECFMYLDVDEHLTGRVDRKTFICPRCFLENHYKDSVAEK